MIKRIITGAILAVALVLIVLLSIVTASDYPIEAVIFLLMAVSLYEMYKCYEQKEIKLSKIGLIVFMISIITFWYLFGIIGYVYALLLASIVVLTELTFCLKMQLGDALATIFTLVYPCVFSACALYLNELAGVLGIISTILVSCFTDMMAYFVGVTVKGKKLCPTISPNKTISGFVGGILGGVIGVILSVLVIDGSSLLGISAVINPYTLDKILVLVAFGILGALLDTIGDLVASRIKRICGIKDYGKIFPGHGGVMDRVDGMAFVVPAMLIMYLVIV